MIIIKGRFIFRLTIGIYEVPTDGADAGAKPKVSAKQLRESVGTWKFIGAFT